MGGDSKSVLCYMLRNAGFVQCFLTVYVKYRHFEL